MTTPINTIVSGVAVSAANPIDDIAAALMQTIARKGRGFVLDLANNDGKVAIEVKESLQPHDEWQAPADYRAHVIETTDSFIEYAKRYGDPKASLVFVSQTGCSLVIDELVTVGEREVVSMHLPTSDDWQAWAAILSKPQDHKTLLRFLLEHENNLKDPGVLLSMQSVKVTSQVNYESDMKDDGDAVGIFFKSTRGDELKQFPKRFDILLPVLDSDVGDYNEARATIRLDITMPSEPTGKPTFTLFCSEWKTILKKRINAEAAKIAEELDGWCVVRGTYGTEPHELRK